MALKFKYESKADIPTEHTAFYAERDGAWVLDVEGAVDKAKLDEFRNSNVALLKERDELKKRFEGIDPEEVRKLAEEKRKLEEERQLKAGEFDKVLEKRLKGLQEQHGKALEALTAERDALTGRLTAIQIDQAVVSEATKRGLRATALPDVTARARAVFRLANGVPTAFELVLRRNHRCVQAHSAALRAGRGSDAMRLPRDISGRQLGRAFGTWVTR
jgi:vacuolar-type H+-ATPase subunit I/STV1